MYREMLEKRKLYMKSKGQAVELKLSPKKKSMGDDLIPVSQIYHPKDNAEKSAKQ